MARKSDFVFKHQPAVARKQLSLFLPVDTHRRLQWAAARKKMPMSELVMGWIQKHLDRLPKAP